MYGKRAECLLNRTGLDAVLITSPKNIYYYSGFTGVEAVLVLLRGGLYIFTDSRYHIQAKQQARDYTLRDIAEQRPADFLLQQPTGTVGFENMYMTVEEYGKLSEKLSGAGFELVKISGEISRQRQLKEEKEIQAIQEAEALGDRAFSYILDKIKPGAVEREIALDLEFYMRRNGAECLAFETICASGARSAMPHGTASGKTIETGDFVTLDFGCVVNGYCGDMTRTVVVGKADERQKQIYRTVLRAQMEALKVIQAGKKAADIDKVARDIIQDAGFGGNFGHSLGHSVGLDIHELPSLSPKSEAILGVGMLETVEPGIYVEGFGGVRIEDLVLITDDGCRNLTASPKELIEL